MAENGRLRIATAATAPRRASVVLEKRRLTVPYPRSRIPPTPSMRGSNSGILHPRGANCRCGPARGRGGETSVPPSAGADLRAGEWCSGEGGCPHSRTHSGPVNESSPGASGPPSSRHGRRAARGSGWSRSPEPAAQSSSHVSPSHTEVAAPPNISTNFPPLLVGEPARLPRRGANAYVGCVQVPL